MKILRLIVIHLLVGLIGCSKQELQKPLPPPEKEIPVIYHQVRYSGETLALIAKWYTGDSKNWKAIQEINPDMDPDRIVLDEVIRIPKSIALKERPFSLIELRRMLKRNRSSADVLSADLGHGAPPSVPKESESGMKMKDSGEEPYENETFEKRRQLQERTRYELLQEMLGDGKDE